MLQSLLSNVPWQAPTIDYHALAPEMVLAAGIVVVLLVDLFTSENNKWLIAPLSGFALLGSLVPVITLAGSRHASRVGASLLSAVGLGSLITNSVDDYVDCAAALAQDSNRRQTIVRQLRAGVSASPLCDAAGFARDFAAALRGMWKLWCETGA